MKLKLYCALSCLLITFGWLVPAQASERVQLGDENLISNYLPILQGKKIGILAHYASRLSDGTHVVDALKAHSEVTLSMIFSPEHGFRSLDDTSVTDSVDPASGVQIYSLYGPRKAPTPEMMAAIDLVLIDLQDVGLRYYTYPATVSYLLRAAKLAGKPVYLLDRPNPLGGEIIDGPVLDASLVDGDLTTVAALPTRTGMTLGETAIFLNRDLQIDADLTVIPLTHYQRSMHWSDTGLKWTPSSPALMTPDQVELYALLGTLEASELATGRGINNSQAFRRYGAPYLSHSQIASLTQNLNLPGLKLSPIDWTPDRSKFMGQVCHGFQVEITDLKLVQGLYSLIQVLELLQKQASSALHLDKSLQMLGSQAVLRGIMQQTPAPELLIQAKGTWKSFVEKRNAALIY